MNNLPTAEQLYNWQNQLDNWREFKKNDTAPSGSYVSRTFGDYILDSYEVFKQESDGIWYIDFSFDYYNNSYRMDWFKYKIPFAEVIEFNKHA